MLRTFLLCALGQELIRAGRRIHFTPTALMTTAAAIDRLVHHSIILELKIQSYRVHAAKKKERKPA